MTRPSAFLLVILIRFGSACMPGYEAERDKLREHLGIEWIPGGLKENFGYSPRYPQTIGENMVNACSCGLIYLIKRLDLPEFSNLLVMEQALETDMLPST
nr:Protein MAM-2, isoform a [Haemonchus contortus]